MTDNFHITHMSVQTPTVTLLSSEIVSVTVFSFMQLYQHAV